MPVIDLATGNTWASSSSFSAFSATSGGTTTVISSSFAKTDHDHSTSMDLETMEADDVMVDTLEAIHVTASIVDAFTVKVDDIDIDDDIQYKGEKYEITDKYHKTGPTLDADEIDTVNKTLVVRNPVDGCRITNLQVRADDSIAFQATAAGSYPGLFFTQGWCSEQLAYHDDGHGVFQKTDASNVPINNQFAKWGKISNTAIGFITKDDTNSVQLDHWDVV